MKKANFLFSELLEPLITAVIDTIRLLGSDEHRDLSTRYSSFLAVQASTKYDLKEGRMSNQLQCSPGPRSLYRLSLLSLLLVSHVYLQ